MKTTFTLLTLCMFSLCSNAQSNKTVDTNINEVENLKSSKTSTPKTIKYYHVKEIINSNFGGSVLSYCVSDISLISTTDLGPNNKRIVTTNDGEIVEIPSRKKGSSKNPLTSLSTNNQVAIKKTNLITKIVATNYIDKKQFINNNKAKTVIAKETEKQKTNDNTVTILNSNFDKKGNSSVDKKENLLVETNPIIINKALKINSDITTTPKNVNNIVSKYTPNQLENYNSSSRIYDNVVNDEINKNNEIVKNKNIEVKASNNFILVNILNTYEKVAEKGYKSIDLFKKIGDQFYFDGEYKKAAKWYGELFTMTSSLDSKYYYHFAHSLKEIGNETKSNEIMIKLNSYNKSVAKN